MLFHTLNPDIACQALDAAGYRFAPSDICIEAREDRWLVRLPGQHLAWFAASGSGLQRLETERRVIQLLESRCTFRVPRVVFQSTAGDFDVRQMVPGGNDPRKIQTEVRENPERAAQLGRAIGAMLAEQHSRITATDVAGWLPQQPDWPRSREWIKHRLGSVIDDDGLMVEADAVMEAYQDERIAETDRALVHTDVGFHNLGIDPESDRVYGIFDYEGAAWADRHHDFRYLVFDPERYELLEAASSVYESAIGYRIQRDRVLLYNAACAVTFLAYRVGTKPEERSCGRTLAEDLRWSRHAIAKVLS